MANESSAARFTAYIDGLSSVIGHSGRVGPLQDYARGLLLPVARKSVEPMAAMTAPLRASAQHQSLLHFVGNAAWSDEKLLAKVQELTLPVLQRREPVQAWIIDDTAFPKKGRHSVGVARQYCGQLGKQENCQVAVSLSVANHHASLPVAWRLYLPQSWADDPAARRQAGVPDAVRFQTKPQIACDQLRAACAAGLPRGVVLMDAGYGDDTWLRSEITSLGLQYIGGVRPHTSVWPSGTGPSPPKKWRGSGRPPTRLRRGRRNRPVSVKQLALGLPASGWKIIAWREGSASALCSRFARVRVRPAHRDQQLTEPRPEEWLLVEWPEGESEPSKYWLATVGADISFEELVDHAKMRWRIERDYQDLKQELGLGDYEGRGWRGFHHHAALCIAAYGFLLCEQQAIPPSGPCIRRSAAASAILNGHRCQKPADPAGAACAQLARYSAHRPRRCARPALAAVSLLQKASKRRTEPA
jgi:SRSO17 transposase